VWRAWVTAPLPYTMRVACTAGCVSGWFFPGRRLQRPCGNALHQCDASDLCRDRAEGTHGPVLRGIQVAMGSQMLIAVFEGAASRKGKSLGRASSGDALTIVTFGPLRGERVPLGTGCTDELFEALPRVVPGYSDRVRGDTGNCWLTRRFERGILNHSHSAMAWMKRRLEVECCVKAHRHRRGGAARSEEPNMGALPSSLRTRFSTVPKERAPA
jgi:hypothetical protein